MVQRAGDEARSPACAIIARTGQAGGARNLDATQKIGSGPFSLPPRQLMMDALDVWKQCGLPELEIPKRARLRIEKS
jgi:hypothetical protein